MKNSDMFNVVPKALTPDNLSYKLSGRENALETAAGCFRILAKCATTTSKSDRRIPVCSGLPGLGKSRMLDEWDQIFDRADITGPHLGSLVVYYNGHKPHPVEKSMTIEASFSWRLWKATVKILRHGFLNICQATVVTFL